ncbi:hypothetical protein ACIOJE_27525 [Kitasatospora sp. NPDC087861]|uniref:hypothetical protein n=1 Tax=Kitasatospora sp. NPDC087861 TaxID=3364070 RepID=UPI003803BA91
MPTIHLVSAAPGDTVLGRELADPDCPEYPGLLERPDVAAWLDALGYGPDNPDELVYLLTDDGPGTIPPGFAHLSLTL